MNNELCEKIFAVRDFIDKNICTDLNVNEIAEKFRLNPKVLTERFVYFFGITPKKYILNKKLEKLMEMLRKRKPGTLLNISRYGYELGFKSAASFCNFIKRSTGKTFTDLMNEI